MPLLKPGTDDSCFARGKIPGLVGRFLPWVCILFPAAAVTVLLATGRGDLALSGLYLFIPISAAGVVGIVMRPSLNSDIRTAANGLESRTRPFGRLPQVFVFLYVVSLSLLMGSDSRPIGYFALIVALVAVILAETQLQGVNRRSGTVLLQIAALLLNLALGQTLTLPFYFGGGDVFDHMHSASTIISMGHITQAMGDYQYFPLFHLLNAQSALLNGLDMKTSYFVTSGLMFAVTVPLVFLLVRRLTRNVGLSLVITLVYAVTREVVYYDMYTVTRSMAFLFCLLILYLFMIRGHSLAYEALIVLVTLALVLTHQITLPVFSAMLGGFMLLCLVVYRRIYLVGYHYFFFLVVAYLSYWMFLASPFFERSAAGLIRVDSDIPLPGVGQLKLPWQMSLLSTMDYAIFVFLALLGMMLLLRRQTGTSAELRLFALSSIVCLALFVPGLSTYVLPGYLAYRLPIMMSPFVCMAAGVSGWLILKRLREKSAMARLRTTLGVCLLLSYCLASPILLAGATDVDLTRWIGHQNHQYFTQAEVSSFSFVSTAGATNPSASDYTAYQYLHSYLGLTHVAGTLAAVEATGDGLFLFREAEYHGNLKLPFLVIQPGYRDTLQYLTSTGDAEPFAFVDRRETVYANGAVSIHGRQSGGAT